ncbi:hypothetical protein AAY473_015372 [Plecturocebus cupreus]
MKRRAPQASAVSMPVVAEQTDKTPEVIGDLNMSNFSGMARAEPRLGRVRKEVLLCHSGWSAVAQSQLTADLTSRLKIQEFALEDLAAAHRQRHMPALQAALDILGARAWRHLNFNEHLLQGLVPLAPRGPARNHPTPLL